MLKISKAFKSKKALLVSILFISILFLINNSTTMMRMAYPVKYKETVELYSKKYGVDPNLVYAIIKAESNFSTNAVSKKQAVGLMQITRTTGAWGARTLKLDNYSYDSLFNPETNIMIGCWYLSTLMGEFDNDIQLVLTAYNAGSGNVNQWLEDKRYSGDGGSLTDIPFGETHKYVKKVNEYYGVYKKLYGLKN